MKNIKLKQAIKHQKRMEEINKRKKEYREQKLKHNIEQIQLHQDMKQLILFLKKENLL